MLNNIVASVLRKEGKVSLPSIGIIVKIDLDGDVTYLFTPVGKKSDGNLVSAIATQMDVSQDEAVNLLDCYVDFIKGVIAKNGKYRINGVGDILNNDNDVFYFAPLVESGEESCESTVVKELREEVISNEVVIEEVEDNTFVVEPVVEPAVEPVLTKEVIVEVAPVIAREPVAKIAEEPVVEQPKTREAIVEEVVSRINERAQTKRLGEVMENNTINRRFYDKLHSQVVAASPNENPFDKYNENATEKPIPQVMAQPPIFQPRVEKPPVIEQPVVEQTVVEQPIVEQPIVEQPIIEPIKPSVEQPPIVKHADSVAVENGGIKRKGIYDIYEKGYVSKEHKTESTINIAPVVEKVTPPIFVAAEAKTTVVNEVVVPKKKKADVVLIISVAVIIIGLAFITYFYYIQQNLEL